MQFQRYGHITVHDKGKRFNTNLLEAVELGFLLELAEILIQGALARKESRSGHARADYPNRDDVNSPGGRQPSVGLPSLAGRPVRPR